MKDKKDEFLIKLESAYNKKKKVKMKFKAFHKGFQADKLEGSVSVKWQGNLAKYLVAGKAVSLNKVATIIILSEEGQS